ncbi:MAG: hypothetical protein GWP06_14335 [Actinobacteria bacterium]|nr:hypothetical protein [Actinomycetota bacterium]
MSKRVVVLDTGYDSYDYEHKVLGEAGYAFEIFPGERHDRAGKIEFAGDAVGLFLRWTEVDDEFLDALLLHPQVIATGHYAWYSTNAAIELQRRAADNLLMMLQGDLPEDCLNSQGDFFP